MQYVPIVILAVTVFLLCWITDKLFAAVFRNKPEHKTGKAVRHNKKTVVFGLTAIAIGIAAVLGGNSGGWLFYAGGTFLALIGAVLIVQYMTFGVFYGDDSFVVTTFGKRSVTYAYRDIQFQNLYNSHGSIVIELYMRDDNSIMLQSGMDGVYSFLDYAFVAWLKQTGRKKEDCTFYDPDNSKWFPDAEGS